MITLFIEYNEFNYNINFVYNLFYYLKIKIQLINNCELKKYIDENDSESNIYIFYEIFDEELFNYLNIKYNKNIYYFIDSYKDLDILENKYEKIKYVLLSHNYFNIYNFKYKKMLLNYQFDINKSYIIKDINPIYIINDSINIKSNIKDDTYIIYDQNIKYLNRLIIIDTIFSEDDINLLIENNNIILIKNFNNLELYFCYNILIIYNNYNELDQILQDFKKNSNKYISKYNNYMLYLKKKLILNNKNFYKNIEEYEEINNKFGFIILRHVNSEESSKFWYESVKNIRKYYRNKIYIIDDNSDHKYLNNNVKMNNIEVIESKFKKRGEILPYYYLYVYELFEKCLIIHDSVFLNKYINFEKYNDNIKFLWHFDHSANNLKMEKEMINLLNNEEINNYYDGKEWYGCFGVMSIIKFDFIVKLNNRFKIFNLLDYIDNRDKRMNFERIFSILCTMIDENIYIKKSIYGDIKKYIKWGYNYNEYIKDKGIDNRELIKIWNGR